MKPLPALMNRIYVALGLHLICPRYLQSSGTEAHRDVFGLDFWIDATLPRWDGMGHTEEGIFGLDQGRDLLFITDVRFANEAERIKEWGGEIWHVVRDSVNEGDMHASEQTLPEEYIDMTIDNNGSLRDLRMTVLKSLMVKKYSTRQGVA